MHFTAFICESPVNPCRRGQVDRDVRQVHDSAPGIAQTASISAAGSVEAHACLRKATGRGPGRQALITAHVCSAATSLLGLNSIPHHLDRDTVAGERFGGDPVSFSQQTQEEAGRCH